MLKLMYITNRPEVAKIADSSGVDRIFVDMEYIGKDARQGGMDTVQSHHTEKDVQAVKSVVKNSQIIVRCNPIHDKTEKYSSSKEEINGIINAGADIVMLPYFKTLKEVQTFIKLVDKRAKTMLLVETPEAVSIIDEILNVDGVDEIHIGLNDLSLGYNKKFMFELLTDGTVEKLCNKFKSKKIPYGFGGIAALGKGTLPSEKVIAEHYRLGSTCAILSRSFCNTSLITNLDEIQNVFCVELKAIRNWEEKCQSGNVDFIKNRKDVENSINEIIKGFNLV